MELTPGIPDTYPNIVSSPSMIHLLIINYASPSIFFQ